VTRQPSKDQEKLQFLNNPFEELSHEDQKGTEESEDKEPSEDSEDSGDSEDSEDSEDSKYSEDSEERPFPPPSSNSENFEIQFAEEEDFEIDFIGSNHHSEALSLGFLFSFSFSFPFFTFF